MTNSQFTVSVQENTNKIISSSEEKFTGIRPGSLIKIDNEQSLYTILNKENLFYIKSFNLLDPKCLLIEDDIGVNLQIGDTIQISFKEYEAILVLDIINGGKNYKNNTELKVKGGDISINISNGIGDYSIIRVVDTDDSGTIKQVGIKNKGKYLVPPVNPIEVFSDDGTNALFELKYNECSNRNILERNITGIYFKDNKSYITLDYSLPLNLKQGKLSVEKHYLIIDKNYQESTKTNVSYQIYRDFTPNVSIPLMAANSLSPSTIFNKMAQIVDDKFQELENRLKKIEDRLN